MGKAYIDTTKILTKYYREYICITHKHLVKVTHLLNLTKQ